VGTVAVDRHAWPGAGQVIAVITPAVSTVAAGRLWLADRGCGAVRDPARQVAAIVGSGYS